MALRCQVASYDRSFTASITAVEKHASDGNVYKVTLDDTVLFPEGLSAIFRRSSSAS
jgi:hypothetical protein